MINTKPQILPRFTPFSLKSLAWCQPLGLHYLSFKTIVILWSSLTSAVRCTFKHSLQNRGRKKKCWWCNWEEQSTCISTVYYINIRYACVLQTLLQEALTTQLSTIINDQTDQNPNKILKSRSEFKKVIYEHCYMLRIRMKYWWQCLWKFTLPLQPGQHTSGIPLSFTIFWGGCSVLYKFLFG